VFAEGGVMIIVGKFLALGREGGAGSWEGGQQRVEDKGVNGVGAG
jgi:hypothetical protein